MLLQCEYLTYVRVLRLVHTSCNFCYSLGPTIVRIENFLSVLKRSGPLCVPQLVVASLNDPYANSTTQPALAKPSEYVNKNIKANIIIE